MSSNRDYSTYPYKLTVTGRNDKPSKYFQALFSNWKDHAGGSAGEVTNKMFGLGVLGAITGIAWGSTEALVNNKINFRYMLFYTGRNVATLGGAGVFYSIGVNSLGQYREKDDLINHMFGGILAGLPLGARFRSFRIGLSMSVAFATAGMWMKYAYETGSWLKLLPLPKLGREVSFRIDHYKSKNRPHEEGTLD